MIRLLASCPGVRRSDGVLLYTLGLRKYHMDRKGGASPGVMLMAHEPLAVEVLASSVTSRLNLASEEPFECLSRGAVALRDDDVR